MSESFPPIRYRFALDQDSLVDIHKLTEADRKDYRCVSCGQVLRAVLGEQRAKHFRHKTDVSCSRETYLHRMGKRIFRQTYEDCLQTRRPYWLNLPRRRYCRACGGMKCDRGVDAVPHNLTRIFGEIREEARDGQFIPDLLLTNARGEKIYIEIAVTHHVSDQKTSSGVRIIEFSIEEEDDLRLVTRQQIDADEPKTALLNFKLPEPVLEDESLVRCDRRTHCFHVSPDGRAQIANVTFYSLSLLIQNPSEYVSEIFGKLVPETFVEELEKAMASGCEIRDCALCESRGRAPVRSDHRGWVEVYCRRRNQRVCSTAAVECFDYRGDPSNLHPPEPEPLEPAASEGEERAEKIQLGRVPAMINAMFLRYAKGERVKNCFLCQQRDISGYYERPDLLICCRVSGGFHPPEAAQECASFAPYSRGTIRRIANG